MRGWKKNMSAKKLTIQRVGIFLIVILALTSILWNEFNKKENSINYVANNIVPNTSGEFTIYSEILKEERKIEISLPKGYKDTEKQYPVLYFLDAEMESRFTNIIDMVESQHDLGVLPQMIIVGIHNTNRNRDTIPVSIEARPGSGGAKQFLMFLDEELVPLINELYRTSFPRVLYGASNAGLFVVYALLEEPCSFDAYIASSPMIGWCPDFIHTLAEETFSKSLRDKFLFMIFGSDDYLRVTRDVPIFVDFLQGISPEGLQWESRMLEGMGHVPPDSLEEGLKVLFHT